MSFIDEDVILTLDPKGYRIHGLEARIPVYAFDTSGDFPRVHGKEHHLGSNKDDSAGYNPWIL